MHAYQATANMQNFEASFEREPGRNGEYFLRGKEDTPFFIPSHGMELRVRRGWYWQVKRHVCVSFVCRQWGTVRGIGRYNMEDL